MSNARQETIADIINEKRTTAREIRSKTPNQYGLELAVMLEAEADRIEAAEKQSVTKCNRLGNAGRMREALETVAEYAKAAACHTEDAHLLGYLNQIESWAEAALAEPPRNCEKENG